MIRILRKDSLITIGVLSLLAAGYYFGIFRPAAKATSQIRRGISAAEQSVCEIPERVAELESLKKEIERRESYLRTTAHLIPTEVDAHTIVGEVTRLARDAGLKITRLEPMPQAQHGSYVVVPFHAGLSGNYQALAQFLKGLETHQRLFHVHDLSIGPENERTEKAEKVDLHFAVYVLRGEKSDFANKADSSGVSAADPIIR